ncbi:MAG: hypothetical protein II704_02030, partial [Erysipelotrichaceae bacterium]|nr:hypothetical protein [Erysipelotrichaceae bacterium]
MRNREKMRKLVCLLMSVGMVFSGNTFSGYSAQAETVDVMVSEEAAAAEMLEEDAPVSSAVMYAEDKDVVFPEEGDYASPIGEEGDDISLLPDIDSSLYDPVANEDILFMDETLTDPDDISELLTDDEDPYDYSEFEDFEGDEEPEDISEEEGIEEETLFDEELSEEELLEEQEEELSLLLAEGSETNAGVVIDGQTFVDALGGDEYALCTSSSENIYAVTLFNDVELDHELQLQSGNFILEGTGTITRAEGYTGTLLKIYGGVALTLGGNVILDGGAVWEKNGESSSPAEGAQNKGIVSDDAMVSGEGSFTLTDNAVIQNNDAGRYYATAVYFMGSVSIEGGVIRNCDGGYGSAVCGGDMGFTMSGGEIYGNRGKDTSFSDAILYGHYNMLFTGGTIRDNTCREVIFTYRERVTVEGGNFINNSGDVINASGMGKGVDVSGGIFEGNGGAINALYSTIYLSGNPEFRTNQDVLQGTAVIKDAITTNQDFLLIPRSTDLGYQALSGDAGLVAQYHERFILEGENTAGLIINSRGRIDTFPTSLVVDGAGFVEALGGEDYAACSENAGVYTVTLKQNTTRSSYLFLESGTYILEGSGTISRSEGYTGTILKIDGNASLTLGGNVVLDGGAVWEKNGEPSNPAEGAQNKGIVSNGAMVSGEGSFTLTDNAIIQNNDAGLYNATAVYFMGSVSIEGGVIRNCDG